jgi:hypothetical protein
MWLCSSEIVNTWVQVAEVRGYTAQVWGAETTNERIQTHGIETAWLWGSGISEYSLVSVGECCNSTSLETIMPFSFQILTERSRSFSRAVWWSFCCCDKFQVAPCLRVIQDMSISVANNVTFLHSEAPIDCNFHGYCEMCRPSHSLGAIHICQCGYLWHTDDYLQLVQLIYICFKHGYVYRFVFSPTFMRFTNISSYSWTVIQNMV